MSDPSETYRTPNGLPIRFDNRFTLTNERTNELTNDYQDQGSNRLVPDAPAPVEKAVIRKRWSFMYGAPGTYWRVSHSSLPAYFGHALHLYSFEAAVEYANAIIHRASGEAS